MNILAVTPDFLPNRGGVAEMTHYLSKYLAEAGHTVKLLSPYEQTSRSVKAPYHYIPDRAARHKIICGYEWETTEAPSVLSLLNKLISEYNVDHILSFHPHYYGQALVLLKADRVAHGLEIPRISSLFHGLELLSCFNLEKRYQAVHQRILERLPSHREAVFDTIHKSDTVFVKSQYTARLTSRISMMSRPHIIGCGILENVLGRYQDNTSTAQSKRRVMARMRLGLPADALIIRTV